MIDGVLNVFLFVILVAEPYHEIHKAIKNILLAGMCNGLGKRFIYILLQHVMNALGIDAATGLFFSSDNDVDGSAGYLQELSGGKFSMKRTNMVGKIKKTVKSSESSFFSSPTSSDVYSSSTSCSKDSHITKVKRIIPDYIIIKQYPDDANKQGSYVCNFEFKKSETFRASTNQCIQQMLTQMHFQKHSFGIVMNSNVFTILFLVKEGNYIRFRKYEENLHDSTSSGLFGLRPEGFTNLFNWVSAILKVSMNPSIFEN